MQANHVMKLASVSQKVQICGQTIQELKKIKGNVYPVCVMGSILSGKSSLLNELIGEEVFKVGKTTRATTKGLWVYPYNLLDLNCTILFIDSQGFDNAFSNDSDEANLILMMMLTCKMLLHNSFGALDSNIVSRLASMAEKLPTNCRTSSCLAFIQRDFSLQMVDSEGSLLEMEQYLDYSLKNLKDKRIIKVLKQTFHKTKSSHSKFTTSVNGLNSYLLPCPVQKSKFSSRIQKLKIDILNNVRQKSNLLTISDFLYYLQEASHVLGSSSLQKFQKVKIFQQIVQDKLKEDQNIQIAAYKSHLSQKIKEFTNNQEFPVPSSLISYRIQKIYSEYFETDKFLIQLLSQKKVEEYNKKTLEKLEIQNEKKIMKFIKNKACEYFQKKQFFEQKIQNFLQQIFQGYAFLEEEKHKTFVQKEYWSMYSKRLKEEKIKQQESLKKEQYKKQKVIVNLELELKQLKSELQLLKEQNIRLKDINEKSREEIEENRRNDEFVKEKLKDYHQQIQKNKQKEVDLCKKIQEKLRNSLNYEDYKIMKENSKMSDLHAEKLINYLEDLSTSIKVKDTYNTQTILSQKERIIQLENMNKMLRVKIEQNQMKGSETTIQYQYRQLSDQYSRFQKETINRISVKDQMIFELNRKLERCEQTRYDLSQQLELLRNSLKDRHKGTEFLQKIIQNKDKSLDSLRTQLMDNMTKYKKQLNETQAEQRSQSLQTNETLSMFIIKNEKLQTKVNDLQSKLQNLEAKNKIQLTQMMQQKQQQIEKLKSYIQEIQLSIQSATQSYTQVTEKMQKIIQSKQKDLDGYETQIKNIKFQLQRYKEKLAQIQHKNDELKNANNRMELEKQELQNKLKREETLYENKIRHISNQNQKLKVEIRQKCSTFEIMLLQLRGENILKEGSCQDSDTTSVQIKKLNQLEEQVLKELNVLSVNQNEQSVEGNKCRNLNRSSSKKKYGTNIKCYENRKYGQIYIDEEEENQKPKFGTGLKKQSKNSSTNLSLFNSNSHKHFKSSLSDGKNLIKGVNLYENFNRSTNTDSLFYNLDRY